MRIRELIPESDYERVADLVNISSPEPVTADTMRRWQLRPSPGRVQRHLIAESKGGIAGYGFLNYEQSIPEGEFYLWVTSHPSISGEGIASLLYDDLFRAAEPHQPRFLVSSVADDRPESLAWAKRRGFQISHHKFASSLVLATFDEAPFAETVKRAQEAGIHFTSMAALPDTEENRRKLFDLNRETGLDVPNGDSTFPSFEDFSEHVFESDWYSPEGQILALDGDEWVGLSSIRYIPANNSMYHNMTGVRRAYRGQGLALALKLLTLRHARALGADFVRTHNDSSNAPMLAINRKLGYQPEPGYYGLKRPWER